MKKVLLFGFSVLVLLSSCWINDDITKKDSPTTGYLKLFFDEGIELHIRSQTQAFNATYKHAQFDLIPSNELECIQSLFNDSCKAICISRALTEKETKQFKASNIVLSSSLVAKEAIAFIVPKNFSDSTISVSQIVEILNGSDSLYVAGKHIEIVFDNQNSGNTRFLKDSLLSGKTFGKNCSATNSTKELIELIANSTNKIGVCSYAWFSDKDDKRCKELLDKVNFLAVSKTNGDVSYMPDQSNIATKDYAFVREVHFIRRSAEFSLAKGLQTFIAGPIGQLMFLKQGLVPNRQEERVIEVDLTPLSQ